jgi:hypothetical protein
MAGGATEIRTEHLLHTSAKHYRYTNQITIPTMELFLCFVTLYTKTANLHPILSLGGFMEQVQSINLLFPLNK